MSTYNIPGTIFNIKKKITLNCPCSAAALGFFPGTQGHVQNISGKRAISCQATEVIWELFPCQNSPKNLGPFIR